jgi:hypothetical protein
LILGQNEPINSQNFEGGFNFNMPPFDSTSQKFLPLFPAKTIGEAERVTVVGDKFMVAGQPIRFWGVNIIGGACFPDKSQAGLIAGRMRKMGINLVRFHDLENGYSGEDGSIFNFTVSTRSLRASTLDRLEFFISELKKNNIYINFNLNTSRRFLEADGVAGADTLMLNRGDFGKGVTLFDPYLQFLQREYAQQILTHLNPYTGLTLAKDPVLAMIELNNENSIYGAWKEFRLRQETLDTGKLTARTNYVLDSLYYRFLSLKYGTNEALRTAWASVNVDLNQLLKNNGFETGIAGGSWVLNTKSTANASIAIDATMARSGTSALRINTTVVPDTDNNLELKQSGFPLYASKTYSLNFWAKADRNNSSIKVRIMQDADPFTWFFQDSIVLTTEWKLYTYTINPNTSNTTTNARLMIMPRSIGTIWLDDLSLLQKQEIGLRDFESLTANNIERVFWEFRQNYTLKRVADLAEFYIDLQKKHFDNFRQYLIDSLQVKTPITGTNALTGIHDAMTQANMDYIDDHKYWDLVRLPRGWSKTDWHITNKSLLKTDNLTSLTNLFLGLKYSNKPYTISEYNHGFPNQYRTEMPATLLAYAGLHGVDGIMFFTYNAYDEVLEWDKDYIYHFLAMHRDHSIMSLFPSCALAYRNGYIQEDNSPILLSFTPKEVYESVFKDTYSRWGEYTPVNRNWGLIKNISTDSYGTTSMREPDFVEPSNNIYVTATNETKFDRTKDIVSTETPNFVALTGFLPAVPNTTVGYLRLIEAQAFGSITWVSLVNKPLNSSEKSLITLSSQQQNTNPVWGVYNASPTLINLSDWGTTPTVQQPNIVKLRLNIVANQLTIYPLSITGSIMDSFVVLPSSQNTFDIILDQNRYKTLWFGVSSNRTTALKQIESPLGFVRVFPNPVSEGNLNLNYTLSQSGYLTIQMYSLQGQLVKNISKGYQTGGIYNEPVNVQDIVNGQYFVFFNFNRDEKYFSKSSIRKIPIVVAH